MVFSISCNEWNYMLGLELIHVQKSGNRILPRYVHEDDGEILSVAQHLINIYEEHRGQSRQKLTNILDDLIDHSDNTMLYRGLSKLLEDRCTFENPTSLELPDMRKEVFAIASRRHVQGNFERQTVLQEASHHLGITTQQIETLLFADLKQNQVMCDFQTILPTTLLQRYNTALAQGVLFKAQILEITIREADHLRYRQLFRAIKFYRLLYRITGSYDQGFTIVLDGPVSLFKACQKYGIQMALFLPALLLCKQWQIEARLQWWNKPGYFLLTDEQGLKSHYPDIGMYMPPELLAFRDRFASLDSEWEISDDCNFVPMDVQEICIPDYVFTHRPTKKRVYLEIFGFWHRAALERRISYLSQQPLPVILAVSKKLTGETQKCTFPENRRLYWYQTVLNPREIAERLGQYLE